MGFGRCRLQVVEQIDAVHLGQFLRQNVAPGSVILSDALRSYPLAIADTFGHTPFNITRSALPAHEVLPGVHRVASLLKRWLTGTHQSGISLHLQAYEPKRRHGRYAGTRRRKPAATPTTAGNSVASFISGGAKVPADGTTHTSQLPKQPIRSPHADRKRDHLRAVFHGAPGGGFQGVHRS